MRTELHNTSQDIESDPRSKDDRKLENSMILKAAPWLFGAGIAAGHVVTASSCTVPQQGRCSICGGCVVALASLVGWALIKQQHGPYDGIIDHEP